MHACLFHVIDPAALYTLKCMHDAITLYDTYVYYYNSPYYMETILCIHIIIL